MRQRAHGTPSCWYGCMHCNILNFPSIHMWHVSFTFNVTNYYWVFFFDVRKRIFFVVFSRKFLFFSLFFRWKFAPKSQNYNRRNHYFKFMPSSNSVKCEHTIHFDTFQSFSKFIVFIWHFKFSRCVPFRWTHKKNWWNWLNMNTLQKEDFVQAVLIADAYDETLQPFVKEGSTVRIKSKPFTYHLICFGTCRWCNVLINERNP